MPLSKKEFASYIKQFNFKELFNDMGWNNDRTSQTISVDHQTYVLKGVAEKRGFKILLCDPLPDGNIPDYASRKKIENSITKLFQEHLIIFYNAKKEEQVWQLVVRQSGKPTKVTETRYHNKQDPELLFQRTSGIFFEIDEEENITIVDVTTRVSDNFHQNNEKVTKAFYEKFKIQHTSFLTFIKGIDDKINQDWYASLMLNRLMFCYFIQKKGFLDNNTNYLREKLVECSEKSKVKFYSFYRDFLLVLFHKGLNEPDQQDIIKIEIGKIPYLNGGLFDEHELERTHKSIDIDDKAFQRLFDFFDEFEWHLDTRVTANGKDINPDVIGYIFEKYINDRAQMGAYYTKEDITEYISKNCILPYLFDETKRSYPNAFKDSGEIWAIARYSGDKYIYEAVTKGIEYTLPTEIEIGIEDIDKRNEWNKQAGDYYALPTETWREVIDRRNKYNEIKTKIETGAISAINDFITYNLNIRQFAQDVIENTQDAIFLKHFYKALNNVTIIDPTCGSGAFLFAAMNILEPLYESCLQRMEIFVAEASKGKHKYFEDTLRLVKSKEHPNLQYFVYKSIILRNLYGVDIMKEAVEIAKLRLFLKLVATVDADYYKPNLGLEPLPDIDFNIRAGNTLIGFATEIELKNALDYTFDGPALKKELLEKCDIVKMAFDRYKEIQLSGEVHNYKDFKEAKDNLDKRLKDLNHSANILLSRPNGANPTKDEESSRADLVKAKKGYSSEYITPNSKYADFLQSHKPFHWFAEFYEIINDRGGFDVIIGNPPYVGFKKLDYTLNSPGFACNDCKDLFAVTIERSFSINKDTGRNGFIIPLSGLSTETMAPLKKLVFSKTSNSWNSYYSASDQPSSLFNGVRHRLLITINELSLKVNATKSNKSFSSNFIKWFSSEREFLFEKSIRYLQVPNQIPLNSKISSNLEASILVKLFKKKTLNNFIHKTGSKLYYHNAPVHWGKIFDFVPYFSIGGKRQQSSHLKELHFKDETDLAIAICLLNSTLFYWFNWQYSNCRDLSLRDVIKMPISLDVLTSDQKQKFVSLKNDLMKSLKDNSKIYKRVSKNVLTEFDAFYPMYSKAIINEIDALLAVHYDFTDEELDYLINYDIKYRMGKELEDDFEVIGS
jgi:hypothetical protein